MAEELKEPTSIDALKAKDRLRAKHNGLLISSLGAIDTKVYGIVLSPFYGMGYNLNGLGLNLICNQYLFVNDIELRLINESGKVNGLQLGLINKTTELNGLQVGLWNVNEKRKFPIVNW
ncbi:MAG: hypothetical protein ACI9DK_000457 [Vicingaceae bacterium]|jgi:hypothetical protein